MEEGWRRGTAPPTTRRCTGPSTRASSARARKGLLRPVPLSSLSPLRLPLSSLSLSLARPLASSNPEIWAAGWAKAALSPCPGDFGHRPLHTHKRSGRQARVRRENQAAPAATAGPARLALHLPHPLLRRHRPPRRPVRGPAAGRALLAQGWEQRPTGRYRLNGHSGIFRFVKDIPDCD